MPPNLNAGQNVTFNICQVLLSTGLAIPLIYFFLIDGPEISLFTWTDLHPFEQLIY